MSPSQKKRADQFVAFLKENEEGSASGSDFVDVFGAGIDDIYVRDRLIEESIIDFKYDYYFVLREWDYTTWVEWVDGESAQSNQPSISSQKAASKPPMIAQNMIKTILIGIVVTVVGGLILWLLIGS